MSDILEFKNNHAEIVSDKTFITIKNLIDKFYRTAKTNNLWWHSPKISISNADGTVLLEWEHNDKVLLVDVLEDTTKYDALWEINNEALYGEESGDINIENDLTGFWEWIAE